MRPGNYLFKSWKLLIAVVMVLGLGLLTTQPAQAKFTGVSISPSGNSIQLHNGQVYNGQLTATNNGDTPKTVEISAGYYSISGDNYDQPNYETSSKYSLMKDWIQVFPTQAIIQPGQSQAVNYTITTPANPPAGTQYATIFVATQPDTVATNGITAISRVGMVIDAYMLDGKTVDQTSIQEENIAGYQPTSPMKASFRIKNEGNIGTKIEYTLRVTSAINGQEVYTSKTEKSSVYPETNRLFTAKWDGVGVGVYNVTLDLTVNGRSHTIKKLVCTIPIWIFILVIIGILSLIAFFVVNHRMAKK